MSARGLQKQISVPPCGPMRLGKGLYITVICVLQRENFPRQMRLPRRSHGLAALTSIKSHHSLNPVPAAAANESICCASIARPANGSTFRVCHVTASKLYGELYLLTVPLCLQSQSVRSVTFWSLSPCYCIALSRCHNDGDGFAVTMKVSPVTVIIVTVFLYSIV